MIIIVDEIVSFIDDEAEDVQCVRPFFELIHPLSDVCMLSENDEGECECPVYLDGFRFRPDELVDEDHWMEYGSVVFKSQAHNG